MSGCSAIVTGGASGLGLATARELVSAGVNVVLVDLSSSEGAKMASKLWAEANAAKAARQESGGKSGGTGAGGPAHGAHGAEVGAPETAAAIRRGRRRAVSDDTAGLPRNDRVVFVAADVTDEAQVALAVAAASELGPLRILVNCAGVGTPGKALGRGGPLALDVFERVIRINLVGTFNVIRLASEAMAATKPVGGERGVIVNTASVAAFDGQIGQPAYAASKGGIVSMTLPLAREFARQQIRVMAIAPGIFDTPMMADLPEEARESLGAQVPHPSRLGKPAEYASLVRHVIENPMLNGETIRLDGAIRMQPR